jgi:hypothetical protein
MMMTKRAWGALALVLLGGLTGCASTDMRTFTDPDFAGYRCSRLLVAARLAHLDQQAEAEDVFLKKLAGTDLTCTRSLDILPPTRQFSDEEMFAILADKDIGAVLLIRETEYYEDQVYIPESSTTNTCGNLSANTYHHGNTASTYGTMNATSWDQSELIGELLAHYDKLDEDLRADLPLKRIWTVATQEESE